jgi:hypothetical protein
VREVTFLLVMSLLVLSLLFVAPACAQSSSATINGIVLDPSGAAIAGAQVVVVNDATGVQYTARANGEGIYVVPNLPPGPYRVQVSNSGFKTIIKPDIVIHVQDALAINFTLPIGAASEIVTVQGGASLINTQDATVSTVIDRQFAENLPMNGRSFQTLIDLTPGVVVVPGGGLDSGQFSVNGQRASANYWTVDGVSANVGSSTLFGGNGAAGAAGTTSVLGGTNSLVSVDALQEFRIQTSTFAPEFGRTPGAQISIVTRSGSSQFHGSAFDYLRNDVLDANNWFANSKGLPKPQERQNDFGGTFSGPILPGRTFFFFSYEGLRLRLPQVGLTSVPDSAARATATPAMQPYLNAFPLSNGPADVDSQGNPVPGAAQFNKSYSNPATLDAYSLRVDQRLRGRLILFARYNYSPSEGRERGVFGDALSAVVSPRITVQQGTIGATFTISTSAANEARFNYSRTNSIGQTFLDGFGGAVPLTSLSFPAPYTAQNARLVLFIFSLKSGSLEVGQDVRNLQRQVNLVDNISLQRGAHSLKFGVDYRRLSPKYTPFLYGQLAEIRDVPSAENGSLIGSIIQSQVGVTLLFHNLSAYAQDAWRLAPPLTVTFGLRWDTDFAPSSIAGPTLPAVTGFNLKDLSQLALAPAATPAFRTPYGNVAPRVGIAYQLTQNQDWGTVLRGGFGVFYDLATSETGNVILRGGYPFTGPSPFNRGGTFPLSPAAAAPLPIQPPTSANPGRLAAFDPNLKLPYALQWNAAFEQGLGEHQSLSVSYIGSTGRRLLQTAEVLSPNSSISKASLVTNAATSDYNALQLQFQRRLPKGLEVLASYTWSHSIDSASAGSPGNGSNLSASGTAHAGNRASSDFDIRHALAAGVTYAIPALKSHPFENMITRGWSIQSVIQARSAAPVAVIDTNFDRLTNGSTPDIRPDVIPGIPLYLHGPQYPGGMALNNTLGAVAGSCSDGSLSIGPFCPPPVDANGNPLRQGNLGRNSLRGFGATQWDFAVHRDFPVHESLVLQFRAELFNVLNHPNFAPPVGDISDSQFGLSTQMLSQYLGGGNLGSGSFSPLYQIGGPRSIQFALKLTF